MTTIRVPERYNDILKNSKSYVGLMGLSVGKADFEDHEAMISYCDFMQKNFAYGVFIIADYPKKHNIMALEEVSERRAEERTRIAGDNMRNALEKITRDYPFVKVARWQHFMDERYRYNLKVLEQGYSSDLTFSQSCDNIVSEFLNTPSNLAKWKEKNQPPISVAKNYLLDELALLVSAPFSFPLPVCEIYPGRNEVHEDVQGRKFSFCHNLHIKDDRVFMEAYYESPNKKD